MSDKKVLKEVTVTINTGFYYYGPRLSDLEMEDMAVEYANRQEDLSRLTLNQRTITSKDRDNLKFGWELDYGPLGLEDITLEEAFDKITDLAFDLDGSVLINGERYIKAAMPVRKKTKKAK